MVKIESLWDLIRTAMGTIACLGIINLGRPDLFAASLTLGENIIVGVVPLVALVLALGGIFFGGYVFFVYCEAIIHVAIIEIIKNLRTSEKTEAET